MRAKKLTTSIAYASFSVLLVIWTPPPSVTVGAENTPPAKSDTLHNEHAEQEIAPSIKLSSETVRSYLDWIIQQTEWPAAGVPPIRVTSFAHLRELSGLSSDTE